LAQLLIKRFEDGVVDGGGEGGHVEDAADRGAAAVDVALTAILAAVAIERSNADERGGLSVAQRAKFRQQSEQSEGADAADALDLLQTLGLCDESGIGLEVSGDGGVERGELFLQQFLARVRQLEQGRQRGVFATIDLVGDEGNQLLPGTDQLGQFGATFGRARVGRRPQAFAV
jgi:hypothetical protein